MRGRFHSFTKITIALVAALVTAEFLMQDVFVASTPRVRPDLADHLVEQTLALVNVDNYIAFFRGDNRVPDNIASVSSQPTLIKGVYAKESEDTSVMEVKVNEVEWQDIQYTKKDGSTITLKIPAGTEPPPPGLF